MSEADHPLVAAVRRAWRWPGGAVVAVSGGPDSIALAAAMNEIGVAPLILAHVNHQLRGPASDGDEFFVRNFAKRLGAPVEVRSVEPVPQEAVMRKLRYEQLQAIARGRGLDRLATGHTRDDQLETLLFRLMRGTGLAGLAGIPHRRRSHGLWLIRPLLDVPRAVVFEYLAANDLDFRTDASNTDRRYARNRIRHDVLPVLLRCAPAGADARIAALAQEAWQFRRAQHRRARRLLAAAELPRADALCIFDLVRLQSATADSLRLLWRLLWRREGWSTGEMTRRHWERLAALPRGGEAAIDCPGGIRIRRLPRVVRAGPGA